MKNVVLRVDRRSRWESEKSMWQLCNVVSRLAQASLTFCLPEASLTRAD